MKSKFWPRRSSKSPEILFSRHKSRPLKARRDRRHPFHARPFVGVLQKSIFKRPCQFLAINARKMAPRTTQWLQERPWNAPTKGLLWKASSNSSASLARQSNRETGSDRGSQRKRAIERESRRELLRSANPIPKASTFKPKILNLEALTLNPDILDRIPPGRDRRYPPKRPRTAPSV